MGMKAIDLRRGMAVKYKDGLWVIVENEKVAKGNWRSSQVLKLKNIMTGQLIGERVRTEDMFEEVYLEYKEMEYLYSSGDSLVFMDPKTFDQVELSTDFVGDAAQYLTPNLVVKLSYVGEKPIIFELPNTVELIVSDTAPQLRGATQTNQMKDAVCEGGAKVKVPAFVEIGEKIKVDTRTGEYLSRA